MSRKIRPCCYCNKPTTRTIYVFGLDINHAYRHAHSYNTENPCSCRAEVQESS